jgi:hypothetical protein
MDSYGFSEEGFCVRVTLEIGFGGFCSVLFVQGLHFRMKDIFPNNFRPKFSGEIVFLQKLINLNVK